MPYRINGADYQRGVFAVPNCVAEEYLRLAGGLSLKALLWMLRRGGEALDVEALAKALGQPTGEIIDALQYWIDRGLVLREDAEPGLAVQPTSILRQQPTPVAPPDVLQETPAAAIAAAPLPQLRPTGTQIADRLEESPELRWLLSEEAPKKLERTIGYDGQSTLLMLHDTYGLPPEVIPMLLQYCVDAGKRSYAYIEAVGQDWGRREIDSIEKADEQIAALKQSQSLWNELRRLTGLQAPKPTAAQSDYLRRWQKEFGFGIEMIHAAYEETAEHTGKFSFAYMHKVLQNWHAAGVKTPAEAAAQKHTAAAAKPRSGAKGGNKTTAPGAAPSYDLEEYERSTLHVPSFAKKEKG
ncbi:MAG: DnaD domain protein [Oscillospiraceae bacterium]|jgi:DnaD/phage-associated family protein|nr:DnaD domain protein [Oscillospiraceae bacterium]